MSDQSKQRFPFPVGSKVRLLNAPKWSTAYKMIGQSGTVVSIAPLQPNYADVLFEKPEYAGQKIVCDGSMLELIPTASPVTALVDGAALPEPVPAEGADNGIPDPWLQKHTVKPSAPEAAAGPESGIVPYLVGQIAAFGPNPAGERTDDLVTLLHTAIDPLVKSAAPIAPAAANQCDGCNLGLPVDAKGNHLREGAVFGIHMACTKHKYAAPAAAPDEVIEELMIALRMVRRLFGEGSPLFIKKLGGPITNGDQDKIDAPFIAIDRALARAESYRKGG